MQGRILLIGTEPLDGIIQALRNRATRLSIVIVTTPAAFAAAITEESYAAICLQHPLPWTTNPSVTQQLAQHFPTVPLIIFAPDHVSTLPYLLNQTVATSGETPSA